MPKTVTSRSVPITITDAGSGVDPATLRLLVDGQSRTAKLRGGLLRLPLARGRHVLRVTVSDRQETKNMEDVGPILPNTRTQTARVAVR